MFSVYSVSQVNLPKLSYRAEIDGLRAVAVISVILYHAEMVLFGRDWFEGGYIGVDIFFVISGYLITRIILSELKTRASFSFSNFYERRARRILPMLFVVIFASFPYAWQKLLPSDFVEYAESVLASLFFSSNFFFYLRTTEYGADSALLKPFLHTWSLGVEEQFYLAFPVIALIAFKCFRAHFLAIIVALSLLSLLFAEWMEVRNSDLNFYLPFSRFWELAAGSLLAYRELNSKPLTRGPLHRVLPALGLCLVVYSILYFDSKTPHPSFHTVIPILGVALIVGFASNDELVGKVLGSKPFVWIGLISYSAYLWHFPIFAFARQESLAPSSYDKLEWILTTIALSVLSFFVVEKPFRTDAVLGRRVFLVLMLASAITVGSVASLVINEKILDAEKVLVEKFLDRGAFWDEHRRFELTYDYSVVRNERRNLLVVGNSHAEDLLKAMSFSYINDNYNLNLVSPKRRTKDINYQVRCLLGFLKDGDTTCTQNAAQGTVEYAPNIIEQYSSADVLLLASRWDSRDIAALPSIIEKALADGKKVVVVSNTPESKTFGERELNRFDRFIFENKNHALPTRSELDKLEQDFYKDYLEGQAIVNQELRNIVADVSDSRVNFADRADFMCDHLDRRCYLFFPQDNAKVLWDYAHTTTDGARVLGRLISETQWLEGFL